MLTPWMQGKAQPQQLMRVGTSLYRRALSFTVTSPKPLSVIRGIEEDGTAQLSTLTAGDEVSALLLDAAAGLHCTGLPGTSAERWFAARSISRMLLWRLKPAVACSGAMVMPAVKA
jgi:hypothetical protein